MSLALTETQILKMTTTPYDLISISNPIHSNPIHSTIHTRWFSIASANINHNVFWQQRKRVRWTAVAGTYRISNGDDLRPSQQTYWIHGLSEWQYLCFQYFISSVSLVCIDHYHQHKKIWIHRSRRICDNFDKFRIKMMIWTFFYFDETRALICVPLNFRQNFNEICYFLTHSDVKYQENKKEEEKKNKQQIVSHHW